MRLEILSRGLRLIMLLAVGLCLCTLRLRAQLAGSSAPMPPVSSAVAKLAQPVQLHLGRTTVGDLAVSIEKQTGVHVVVANHLKERRLIVEMEGISGQTALEALAQLHEWRLTFVSETAVMLSRPPTLIPEQMQALPASLQNTLPSDVRRYLQVPSPSQKTSARVEPVPAEIQAISQARTEVWQKTVALVEVHKKHLYEMLQLKLGMDKRILYRDLTVDQQEKLLSILVLGTFADMYSTPTRGFNLLQGVLYPYQADATKALITVKGGGIDVGTVTSKDKTYYYQSFGEQIAPIEQIPDPLHLGRTSP